MKNWPPNEDVASSGCGATSAAIDVATSLEGGVLRGFDFEFLGGFPDVKLVADGNFIFLGRQKIKLCIFFYFWAFSIVGSTFWAVVVWWSRYFSWGRWPVQSKIYIPIPIISGTFGKPTWPWKNGHHLLPRKPWGIFHGVCCFIGTPWTCKDRSQGKDL